MQLFRDQAAQAARNQPFKPNLAARLYAAIGGTAANQAVAITLGYEVQHKLRSVNRPAGSKRHGGVRHLIGGAAFTMPHRPFRHGRLGAR